MKNNSEAIIGTWRLISFEFRRKNGEATHPFGKTARGSLIYTRSGRFSGQLMRTDHPRFAIADQMQGTPQEIEAAYKGSISYFGAYEADVENAVIHHHVEGSIFPNMEGTDQKRFFVVSENQLQLRTPPFTVGGERVIGVLVWERIE